MPGPAPMASDIDQRGREDGAFAGYAPPQDRPPLGSYAVLAAAFNAGLAGFLIAARREGWELPERFGAADIVLTGAASHKLSRLVAKERVMSFLRAPFRRYEGSAGPAEVEEEARGNGLRAAIGELVGCPFCLDLWIAGAMAAGLVVAPKETRFIGGVFASLTVADFLQVAYKAAQDRGLTAD